MANEVDFDHQLTALWASEFRRGWLSRGRLKLYVRSGYHVIDARITKCLDIANVSCRPTGQGTFTRFIEWLEIDFMPRTGGVVFVENIINPRLASFLDRRGYTRDRQFTHRYLKVDKRETD
jgi:hypothetical protein